MQFEDIVRNLQVRNQEVPGDLEIQKRHAAQQHEAKMNGLNIH